MKSVYVKPLSIILIVCLGIIVYSNTFFCSFHLDDRIFIAENPAIKNIQDLLDIWKYYPGRFVTFFSLALNYHFNGPNVFGYHLINLVVHLVSSILVWWLTLLTFSTPAMKDKHANAIALFAGLIFVSHPVQTEAVTYIWQRTTSIAALFYLASLSLYVKSRLLVLKPDVTWKFYYFGSLFSAILAMFTKESAITLPLMILLYEASFFKTNKNFSWKFYSPFLLTILIIPLTMLFTKTIDLQGMHRAAEGPLSISPAHYLLTQFRVIVTYMRLAFFPFSQNLDYDYPIFKNFFEFHVIISFLFLMSVLFGAIRMFSKHRLLSFSIFWFFLTLLPESSFIPFNDVIVEHRLYLPLAGYSIFLASGMYFLGGKNALKTMVVALILIITCYSVLTYQRNKVWKDDVTLWDDTVRKSPDKVRPLVNRGRAYLGEGNFTQAMSYINKAIERDPNSEDAYNNRGLINVDQGNLTQAISDFNKAIELSPNYAEAYNNRGFIFTKQGDLTQAMSDYNRAIAINPNFPYAFYMRGLIYNKQGDFTHAISDLTKAIEIDPKLTDAYYNRGSICLKLGNFNQAIFDFTEVIGSGSRDEGVYNYRGVAFGERKDFTQAISDFTKAIEINPKFSEAYYNRAGTYYQLNEYKNAWVDVHKAEELGYAANPGFISALKESSGQNE